MNLERDASVAVQTALWMHGFTLNTVDGSGIAEIERRSANQDGN